MTLFLATLHAAAAGCGPTGCPSDGPPPDEIAARAAAPVPPIDRHRPERVAVATFALG